MHIFTQQKSQCPYVCSLRVSRFTHKICNLFSFNLFISILISMLPSKIFNKLSYKTKHSFHRVVILNRIFDTLRERDVLLLVQRRPWKSTSPRKFIRSSQSPPPGCPTRHVKNVQFPARHLSSRGTRVLPQQQRVYPSRAPSRQHALIREIRSGPHLCALTLWAKKFLRIRVRMRAVVSPTPSPSAVYQIAAVNPVTGGRASRGERRRREIAEGNTHGGRAEGEGAC